MIRLRPCRSGGGSCDVTIRSGYGRRQTVSPAVMVATVGASRLHSVPGGLRVDEIAASGVRSAGWGQLLPVHSETVPFFQARPLTLYQWCHRLENTLEHVTVGISSIEVRTACSVDISAVLITRTYDYLHVSRSSGVLCTAWTMISDNLYFSTESDSNIKYNIYRITGESNVRNAQK